MLRALLSYYIAPNDGSGSGQVRSGRLVIATGHGSTPPTLLKPIRGGGAEVAVWGVTPTFLGKSHFLDFTPTLLGKLFF